MIKMNANVQGPLIRIAPCLAGGDNTCMTATISHNVLIYMHEATIKRTLYNAQHALSSINCGHVYAQHDTDCPSNLVCLLLFFSFFSSISVIDDKSSSLCIYYE